MLNKEESQLFEQQVAAKVAELRESTPERRASGASALLKEINEGIRSKTFNSAPLLRSKSEVLLQSGQRDEAIAAFNTYISLQKLSLFKAKSGAASLPDSLEGTVRLFSLFLNRLSNEGIDLVAKIIEYGQKLLEISSELPQTEQNDKLIAPVVARSYLAKMILAEGEQAYDEAVQEAKKWFALVDTADADAESCYALGLFTALVGAPQDAFEPVKLSLQKQPSNLRSALLFIQLLTTNENQLGAALELANAYLAQGLKPDTVVGKLTLLQLKKTQIALVENLYGRDAALEELEGFIDTANSIYGRKSSKSSQPKKPIKVATKRSLFSRKREVSFSSAIEPTDSNASLSGSGNVEDSSSKQPTHKELSRCWMWIALQYSKFGLDDEALEAMEQAREMWPNSQSIKALAHTEALLGHINRKTNPKKALVHYNQSLVSYSLHVSSAVGAARLVCDNIKENEEFAVILLGFLESICTRAPGRFLPETWYSRGLLHEAISGAESARAFFWKAIELEERRGVTAYLLQNAAV